jgi:hypothetical protein
LHKDSEFVNMKISFRYRTLLILALAVSSSFFFDAVAVSAADISTCANKRTGVIRVATVCRKTEYLVVLRQESLDTVGLTGNSGATGSVGNYAVASLADAAVTLTAAQLVNNTLFSIVTMGTARTLTMDTGANIALAYSGEVLGSSFEFVIWNRGTQSATLAGNVTAILDATGVVATNKIVKFLCMFTTITAGSEIVNCRFVQQPIP